MEFASADPSVVESIRPRYLLNEWLRAAGKPLPMPLLRDFHLDRVVRAIIDRAFVPAQPGRHPSDEAVDLD